MNLPEPKTIKDISQRLAILDAAMSPEWEYRYYSFNNSWDTNQQMTSMRDGSRTEYYILFEGNNCGIKIWDKKVNEECKKFVSKNKNSENSFIFYFIREPAFYTDDSGFLAFWDHDQNKWKSYGKDENYLLHIFSDPQNEYIRFSKEYYEKNIPDELISNLFSSESIDRNTILKINDELVIKEFIKDAEEIGLNII